MEVELVRWIQARNKEEDINNAKKIYISSEDEDEEEHLENQKHQKRISKDTCDNFEDSDETTSEELELPNVVNKFEALSTDI